LPLKPVSWLETTKTKGFAHVHWVICARGPASSEWHDGARRFRRRRENRIGKKCVGVGRRDEIIVGIFDPGCTKFFPPLVDNTDESVSVKKREPDIIPFTEESIAFFKQL
jgi:hypothetical protein